ncbi:MAG TPA: 2OG-Fe(II) oxygenase [Elainellaceae cyanobacterium]
MSYVRQNPDAFPDSYLKDLQGEIQACPYFATNNLNRDFIATKGFSVVFQRSGLSTVERQFPFFKSYLDHALQPSCNAFYLNPLWLNQASRVDPHIDRSLRSYCKTIAPPLVVSVLYIQVPTNLSGGVLVLSNGKKHVKQIKPCVNTLLFFQGDLTHSVTTVQTPGTRLSLVCEQYALSTPELWDIPEFKIESRAIRSSAKSKRKRPLAR